MLQMSSKGIEAKARKQDEAGELSNQIKSNMALIWVGKPQPSIKLYRLIR